MAGQVKGALSLVTPTDDEAQEYKGATNALINDLILSPDDRQRNKIAAWGEGLASPSQDFTGALGKALGKQNDYSMEDRKLKAQYTPLIIQALAAQQQAAANARMTAGLGGLDLKNMTLDQVAQYKVVTGKDLMPQWEMAKFGKATPGGNWRELPDGTREYMPKLPDGAQMVDGQTSEIPGTTALMAKIEGAKTEATKAAESGWTIVEGFDPVTKEPKKYLQRNVISQMGGNSSIAPAPGVAPSAPVAPPGTPPAATPAPPVSTPPGAGTAVRAPVPGRPVVAGVDQRARDGEARSVLEAELKKSAEVEIPAAAAAVQAAKASNNPQAVAEAQAAYQRALNDNAGIRREIGRNPAGPVVAGAAPVTPGVVVAGSTGAGVPSGPSQAAKTSAESLGKTNDSWIKNSYEPVLANGQAAGEIKANIATARSSLRGMDGTGFGTEAKVAAARVLGALGVEKAEQYASNGQLFQQAALAKLIKDFEGQKGQQTEGDAKRIQATYVSLGNTKAANQYILDIAQAKADRDAEKHAYYLKAMPLARDSGVGDMGEVDRRWNEKFNKSIFDYPSMKRWKDSAK